MPARKPGKLDLTKLMTWEGSLVACRQIWDEFEKEFHRLIDAEISAASYGSFGSGIDGAIAAKDKVERLQLCKANFEGTFAAWKAKSEVYIQQNLLKQGGKRKTRGVSTRNSPRNGGGIRPTKQRRKRGRPANPLNAHKRKHVRTGRPRGWNNGRLAWPAHRAGNHPSVRELRKRRAAKRKEVLAQRRTDRNFRALRFSKKLRRYWKPYPWRREPKRGGWLARWLTGWAKKAVKSW